MDIMKQRLNHMSGPGPLNRWCFWHRVCIWRGVKPLYSRSDPSMFWLFNFGRLFCQPLRGEHICEKHTRDKNQTIIFDFQRPKCFLFVVNHLKSPRTATCCWINSYKRICVCILNIQQFSCFVYSAYSKYIQHVFMKHVCQKNTPRATQLYDPSGCL